jgi:RNA methyltransferase, TrmH family
MGSKIGRRKAERMNEREKVENIGYLPSPAQIKTWKKLKLEKYRRKSGVFLSEGRKVVDELLRSHWPVKEILIRDDGVNWVRRNMSVITEGLPVFRLTNRQWEALSQDPSSEGVIAVASRPATASLADELALAEGPILLLYQANNPNNLGALLRSARWFGFSLVVLGRHSCEATNPKAIRASMGSLFYLKVIEDIAIEEALADIKRRFLLIASDVRQGVAPHPCKPRTALLLGSESHGLSETCLSRADEIWNIPGAEGTESLSLPQAGAIMMYECVRKDSV